jgi:hypothetical protein
MAEKESVKNYVIFFFFLLLFTAPAVYIFILSVSWKWAIIAHLVITLLGALYLSARNTIAETVVFTVILSLIISFGIRSCHKALSADDNKVEATNSLETPE